ncbi:hypothetical protein VM1G_05148 [Cytospora mali]|uniref:Transmembrane protein n=1 Tax=Cytospora mali TaxID=578113 RepID=A0A194VZF8_CYTMA|nr:hypothetical protein VM1G_05148 [Valsa mali]
MPLRNFRPERDIRGAITVPTVLFIVWFVVLLIYLLSKAGSEHHDPATTSIFPTEFALPSASPMSEAACKGVVSAEPNRHNGEMHQEEAMDDQDGVFRQTATWTSVQPTPFDWAVIYNTETPTDLVPRPTISKPMEGFHNEQSLVTDASRTPMKKRNAPYTIDPVFDQKDDIDVPDQAIGYIRAMCIAWACMLVCTLSYAVIVYTKEICDDDNYQVPHEEDMEQEHDEHTLLLGRDTH